MTAGDQRALERQFHDEFLKTIIRRYKHQMDGPFAVFRHGPRRSRSWVLERYERDWGVASARCYTRRGPLRFHTTFQAAGPDSCRMSVYLPEQPGAPAARYLVSMGDLSAHFLDLYGSRRWWPAALHGPVTWSSQGAVVRAALCPREYYGTDPDAARAHPPRRLRPVPPKESTIRFYVKHGWRVPWTWELTPADAEAPRA